LEFIFSLLSLGPLLLLGLTTREGGGELLLLSFLLNLRSLYVKGEEVKDEDEMVFRGSEGLTRSYGYSSLNAELRHADHTFSYLECGDMNTAITSWSTW
jgi:hypothetical protein